MPSNRLMLRVAAGPSAQFVCTVSTWLRGMDGLSSSQECNWAGSLALEAASAQGGSERRLWLGESGPWREQQMHRAALAVLDQHLLSLPVLGGCCRAGSISQTCSCLTSTLLPQCMSKTCTEAQFHCFIHRSGCQFKQCVPAWTQKG